MMRRSKAATCLTNAELQARSYSPPTTTLGRCRSDMMAVDVGTGTRRASGMSGYTVLGASGFIGQHLVRYLRQNGETVWTPPRDAPEIYAQDLGRVVYCIGLTGDFIERPLDTVEAHVCQFAA